MAGSIQRISPHDFVRWTVEQSRRGFGLVPFVGSGVSAPSGILTGQDFANFLTWTVYRCVATKADGNERHHDLRCNGWPEPPNQQEVEQARKWVWKNFVRICGECGAQVRRKDSHADPMEADLLKTTLEAKGDETDPEEMNVAAIVSKDASATASAAPGDGHSTWRLLRPLTPAMLWSSASDKEDTRTKDLLISQGRPQALRTPPLRQEQFVSSLAYVEEAAIRSLHEWRGTLDFLSRLLVDNSGLDAALRLDEQPSQAVIDSFNLVITRGKRPNLAHNMLCHLAGRARIHTILTTNFDSLIEDAFGDLGEKLTAIPVSLHGTLPSAETVAAQNCVVKLHGSLLETRADFSLDDPPPRGDLQRFFEYVRGRPPGVPVGSGHLPALLLVCGYSGSDLRCVQMIQYLLDADPEAKVLWVCYKPSSVQSLEKTFASYGKIKTLEGNDDRKFEALDRPETRVIVTTTNRCDLLLYDLYQRLTLSLTRGGHNYQFNPNVPPGLDESQSAKLETPDDPHDAEEVKKYLCDVDVKLEAPQKQLVCDLLTRLLPVSKPVPDQRLILTAEGESGLLPPLRTVFHRMTEGEGRQGAWLWLGDHDSTMSLAHELFTVIALRLGRFQLDHAQFGPSNVALDRDAYEAWKEHFKELFEHWNLDPSSWFVVIDGHNGYAGSAGWSGDCWKEKEKPRVLIDFLRALQDARNPLLKQKKQGLAVLYAPCSLDRARHLRERLDESRPNNVKSVRVAVESSLQSFHRPPQALKDHLKKAYELHCREPGDPPEDKREPDGENLADHHLRRFLDVVEMPSRVVPKYFGRLKDAVDFWIAPPELHPDKDKWNPDKAGARQALYAACLFRQSRHFAAFLSEGVVPCPYRYNAEQHDNDLGRYRKVSDWLKHWKEHELLYEKTGGFVWMYRDLRLSMKHILEHGVSPVEVLENCWLQNLIEKRARTHFWIADWYTRAFRATGHSEPLVEALYHYSRCIVNSPYARMGVNLKKPDREKDQPAPIARYQRRYARRALFEIIKTLRIGRREIRFWMQSAAGETWFRVRVHAADKVFDPEHIFSRFEDVFKTLHGRAPKEEDEDWKAWLDQLEAELAQHPHEDDIQNIVFSQIETLPAVGKPWDRPYVFLGRPNCLKRPGEWWNYLKGLAKKIGQVDSTSGLRWVNRIAPHNDPDKKDILDWLIAELKIHLDPTSDPKARDFKPSLDPKERARVAAQRLDSNFRQTAVYISETFRGKPEKLYVIIQLLLEMAYATILCVKRLEYCKIKTASPLQRDEETRKLWVEVCALCALSLDLCLDLPPSLWEHDSRLRIFAGTLYGLALGRLGRFFEAHRRLNEAHGWLSKTEAKLEPLEVAIIEIRRAEVHLLEAIRLKAILETMETAVAKQEEIKRLEAEIKKLEPRPPGPHTPRLKRLREELEECRNEASKKVFSSAAPFDPLLGLPEPTRPAEDTIEQWQALYLPRIARRFTTYEEVRQELARIHTAKLDEAWVSLEPAERALSGKTHSSLWWGQLHTLRLRIYAAHWWRGDVEKSGWRDYRACMFRRRGDHLRSVEKLFWAARAAYRQDAYHMLRLIHHTVGALKTAWRHTEAAFSMQGPVQPDRTRLHESIKERLKLNEIIGANYDNFKTRITAQYGGQDPEDLLRDFYDFVKEELLQCLRT